MEESKRRDIPYYDGFTERWTDATEQLAGHFGVDSVLIMQSTPTHMVTAASGGPARTTYVPGGAGPKSVNPGHHKLYCEQVVNDDRPLIVPDAAADPEWRGNEDLVRFGFGFYVGVPIHDADGNAVGTVCALHPTHPPGKTDVQRLQHALGELATRVEADIATRR